MVDRLLLATTLRDDYEVLARDDGSYAVAAIDRHGTRHEDRVGADVADWLRERLHGRRLDKDEAAEVLAPAAERLGLPVHLRTEARFLRTEGAPRPRCPQRGRIREARSEDLLHGLLTTGWVMEEAEVAGPVASSLDRKEMRDRTVRATLIACPVRERNPVAALATGGRPLD